ncbi:MAG TPA: hypothetical protein VHC69_25450 [Polyangiaceae bacterium]|nr:hypothetical protein [Polyangiaceae bacterium]
MTVRAAQNGARRGRRPPFALLTALLGAGACHDHGVVGVTVSKNIVERDATTPSPDAEGSIDATIRSDAADASGFVSVDDCLPVNAANLDPTATQHLIDGTGDSTSMRFLYPYDGTVYPQGIPGPVLMWDGPAPDVVYVRIHSRRFDYRGCLKPSALNRLELPTGIWDLAFASARGATDPFTLDLKVASGEGIYGPISEQLVIANGALTGSVYYMTTQSPAAVGGVLRVRGGRSAEAVLTPPSCAGCHGVSANGTRLLAFSSGGGSSFSVSGASPLTPLVSPTPGAEFAGVYPDGSVYVASAHPTGGGGPRSYGGGVTNAALYDTATGSLVGDSGVPTGACMPMFSPDGQQLVFTDFGASAGHTLATMRFSIETRTASSYQALYAATSKYVGWPAFLPDASAVVFAQGDAPDFSGLGAGLIPVIVGPQTDPFIVDTTTRMPLLLAQAAGFHSASDVESGQTYLPGGAADLHQNYYPTVSPVAAGGYAWIFFDSVRSYGNQGTHRAIWGTAVSISADGTYGSDPSHPAFYLPGQDPNTPNFRALAVLEP